MTKNYISGKFQFFVQIFFIIKSYKEVYLRRFKKSNSSNSNVGRVAGLLGGTATLSENYAFSGMTLQTGSVDKTLSGGEDGSTIHGSSKSAAEITGDFFTSLFSINDDSPWQYTPGKLPVLKGLAGQSDALPSHISQIYFAGLGNEGDPYLIKTAADLATLAELVNEGTSYEMRISIINLKMTSTFPLILAAKAGRPLANIFLQVIILKHSKASLMAMAKSSAGSISIAAVNIRDCSAIFMVERLLIWV